jgi:outer membrane lipoprotein SlyB
MSLFDTIASKVKSSVESKLPSIGVVGAALGGAAIGKFVPKKFQGAAARALRGDISGAISSGITGFIAGAAAKKLGKNKLLGGITIGEARRIASEIQSVSYAKKNLWYLELGDGAAVDGFEDIAHTFNLFATDVSFTPWTIQSEAKDIGMGVMDIVTGSERTELRITTYDDTVGTIKSWFDAKCASVSRPDGTIGLPVEYLVKITIIQSATDAIGGALFGSYKQTFVMRPTSIEVELSRSEDALQQLQMTFSQFDTFMYQGQ